MEGRFPGDSFRQPSGTGTGFAGVHPCFFMPNRNAESGSLLRQSDYGEEAFREMITRTTLALSLERGEAQDGAVSREWDINGKKAVLGVKKNG